MTQTLTFGAMFQLYCINIDSIKNFDSKYWKILFTTVMPPKYFLNERNVKIDAGNGFKITFNGHIVILDFFRVIFRKKFNSILLKSFQNTILV